MFSESTPELYKVIQGTRASKLRNPSLGDDDLRRLLGSRDAGPRADELRAKFGAVPFHEHPFAEEMREMVFSNTLKWLHDELGLKPENRHTPKIYILPKENYAKFLKEYLPEVNDQTQADIPHIAERSQGIAFVPTGEIYVSDQDTPESLQHTIVHEHVHLLEVMLAKMKVTGTSLTGGEAHLYIGNRLTSFKALTETVVESVTLKIISANLKPDQKNFGAAYTKILALMELILQSVAEKTGEPVKDVRLRVIKTKLLGQTSELAVWARLFGIQALRTFKDLSTEPSIDQVMALLDAFNLDRKKSLQYLLGKNNVIPVLDTMSMALPWSDEEKQQLQKLLKAETPSLLTRGWRNIKNVWLGLHSA